MRQTTNGPPQVATFQLARESDLITLTQAIKLFEEPESAPVGELFTKDELEMLVSMRAKQLAKQGSLTAEVYQRLCGVTGAGVPHLLDPDSFWHLRTVALKYSAFTELETRGISYATFPPVKLPRPNDGKVDTSREGQHQLFVLAPPVMDAYVDYVESKLMSDRDFMGRAINWYFRCDRGDGEAPIISVPSSVHVIDFNSYLAEWRMRRSNAKASRLLENSVFDLTATYVDYYAGATHQEHAGYGIAIRDMKPLSQLARREEARNEVVWTINQARNAARVMSTHGRVVLGGPLAFKRKADLMELDDFGYNPVSFHAAKRRRLAAIESTASQASPLALGDEFNAPLSDLELRQAFAEIPLRVAGAGAKSKPAAVVLDMARVTEFTQRCSEHTYKPESGMPDKAVAAAVSADIAGAAAKQLKAATDSFASGAEGEFKDWVQMQSNILGEVIAHFWTASREFNRWLPKEAPENAAIQSRMETLFNSEEIQSLLREIERRDKEYVERGETSKLQMLSKLKEQISRMKLRVNAKLIDVVAVGGPVRGGSVFNRVRSVSPLPEVGGTVGVFKRMSSPIPPLS